MKSDTIRTIPEWLRTLFPFEQHYADIGGYKMHYLDEGEGPVVILLHGNPTWSFYYRNLVNDLKSDFRVIVPDYIGCGLSDHPADAHFRAVDRIDHLESLLAQLGITRFSLVMHDWGGSIGTGLAARMPESVEKLVYLNTTLTETEALPFVIKLATTAFVGKFLTKYSMRFLKLMTGRGVCKRLSKDVKKGYYYPYKTSERRTAIWDFVADIPFDSSHPTYAEMLDLPARIAGLGEVPVQIDWGLQDPCFHREMLNKVALHFPQAEILEIPDASHLVLEDARELAGETIKKFLKSAGSELSRRGIDQNKSSKESLERGHALYGAFVDQAERAPQRDAVIEPLFLGDTVHYKHTNFESLNSLINKYQRGLSELGLRAGDKVLMLVPAGVDFLALSYAVMGRGAIPFFIDPGIGKENLYTCIAQINPDVFIGSPRAQLLRLKRKKLFPSLRFHLTASEWIFTGGPNLSLLKKFSSRPMAPAPVRNPAFVAFTSGGTGTPKGVEYTHEMIREQLRIFKDVFGFAEGSKDLPLLPIFSLFTGPIGVTSILPPIDSGKPLSVDASKVVRVIMDHGPEFSFGSPTVWNKIAEYCVRSRKHLTSIRKIFIAGAPVARSVLERLRSVLEQGEVFTPYGATEALPVTLMSATEILSKPTPPASSGEIGTPVGRAVPGIEMKIIHSVDAELRDIQETTPLPPFEIGEVIVKGGNVSQSYFNRPDADRASKIRDGNHLWHRMGDMGYCGTDGELYFCGRQKHVVSSGGHIYYSIPAERVFNQHEKVRRSALVSLHRGRDVGIVIEPHPQYWPETEAEKKKFREELLLLGGRDPVTRSITNVFFHPSFPVDSRHNAKIFRDRLGEWASGLLNIDRAA